MIEKLKLISQTVRFLKWKQIRYQITYRLVKAKKLTKYNGQFDKTKVHLLGFTKLPPVYRSVLDTDTNHFTFLNLEKQFGATVDWDFQEYGKLWNYNLQYGNYLLQTDISRTRKVHWLSDIYARLDDGRLIPEPYPASLRSVNVIRWMSTENELLNGDILSHLHAELDFLSKRLEFHLLGNHLLENLFALLMGGAFYDERSWIEKSQKLLGQQLNEQVLPDGGHFELSPMYHQIILFRLLELLDWYRYWQGKDLGFEQFIIQKAEKMLAWLQQISFRNGDIPHLNDSAEGIAYSTHWLAEYGKELGLQWETNWSLKESGYRKYHNDTMECVVDVGHVGASYQPGHAHADSLNFVLSYDDRPIIVDTGISTYEKNARRQLERSTSSHNTVTINNLNSSEVWSGFRVGKRAVTRIIEESEAKIMAQHDGYKHFGVLHRRSFEMMKLNGLIVEDLLDINENSKTANLVITGYLHFHPDMLIERKENIFLLNQQLKLTIQNATSITIEEYQYAKGYNDLAEAKRLVYTLGEKSIQLYIAPLDAE